MLSCGKFRFVRADTDDLREKTYRLRYRIYVEEFGFEKPEDHPGGQETDGFDAHAIHFAALNHDGEVVGTVRLILHSDGGFPMEHAVNIRFPGEKPPPEKIAEISRLAVHGLYRRRRGSGPEDAALRLDNPEAAVLTDQGPVPGMYTNRKTPIIVMGLYQMMIHESKRLGLTHWYMITDQKAHKTFTRFGFLFHPIGGPVEYHGLRTPYLGVISEIENNVMRENPFLMKMMLRGLTGYRDIAPITTMPTAGCKGHRGRGADL